MSHEKDFANSEIQKGETLRTQAFRRVKTQHAKSQERNLAREKLCDIRDSGEYETLRDMRVR
jgi:hypothetical protein